MAVARLRESDARSFVLPGVDIVRGALEAEVDLYGTFQGQLIVGEAKVSPAGFTTQQIERDLDICRQLGGDCYLMACPEKLPQDTIDLATDHAHKVAVDLIVVNGFELLTLRGA